MRKVTGKKGLVKVTDDQFASFTADAHKIAHIHVKVRALVVHEVCRDVGYGKIMLRNLVNQKSSPSLYKKPKLETWSS